MNLHIFNHNSSELQSRLPQKKTPASLCIYIFLIAYAVGRIFFCVCFMRNSSFSFSYFLLYFSILDSKDIHTKNFHLFFSFTFLLPWINKWMMMMMWEGLEFFWFFLYFILMKGKITWCEKCFWSEFFFLGFWLRCLWLLNELLMRV